MDNTNKQLNLSLDLVEGGIKTRTTAPKPVDSTKRLLEGVDWALYEENVLKAVEVAIRDYAKRFAFSPEDKAFQISIWTDPQSRKTAISFETKHHAEIQIQEQIAFWRSRGNERGIKYSESLQYNDNPADFQYLEFYTILNHELSSLQELDFRYQKHTLSAELRITTSLLNVLKRIADEGIIKPLPKDETVWIGISSPHGWYDCVQTIR